MRLVQFWMKTGSAQARDDMHQQTQAESKLIFMPQEHLKGVLDHFS